MTDFTTNLHFELVDFDAVTWHDQEHSNWIITDAAIKALGVTGILGIWQNSTAYVVGNRLVDNVSFTLWECLIDHVSAAAPTTFAANRAANPTFWTPLTAFTGITYLPIVDDVTNIGAATHRFANVFLKSLGTINFGNGNYIITHAAGQLTFNGNIIATIAFVGASNVVLGTTGPNTIFLRPNGAASGTNQITIDSTGLVDMSGAAGQIKFPSTAVNSADANTLDGYTDWKPYTPTFTGFGTVTGVSMWSKRVGDMLYIRGRVTSGVATAVEGRMTLGYNGTNANVSSDATKVTAIQLAGHCAIADTIMVDALIESNVGYITFARSLTDGLTKANGSTFISTGVVLSITAQIPISGW